MAKFTRVLSNGQAIVLRVAASLSRDPEKGAERKPDVAEYMTCGEEMKLEERKTEADGRVKEKQGLQISSTVDLKEAEGKT